MKQTHIPTYPDRQAAAIIAHLPSERWTEEAKDNLLAAYSWMEKVKRKRLQKEGQSA